MKGRNGSGPILPSDAIAKGLPGFSIPSRAFLIAVSSGVPTFQFTGKCSQSISIN
jgi:hypothetical protein